MIVFSTLHSHIHSPCDHTRWHFSSQYLRRCMHQVHVTLFSIVTSLARIPMQYPMQQPPPAPEPAKPKATMKGVNADQVSCCPSPLPQPLSCGALINAPLCLLLSRSHAWLVAHGSGAGFASSIRQGWPPSGSCLCITGESSLERHRSL